MGYEDDLIAQARAALADLHESLEDIRATTSEIIAEGARDLAADEEHDEARARRARAGDLGPEWVRLQQRIDRGETSLSDIARGFDDTADADAVRERVFDNLADLRRELEGHGPDDDLPTIHVRGERPGPTGAVPPEARAAMAQARATMARLEAAKERVRNVPVENPYD